MAFATDNDLMKYAPEMFNQGIDTWTQELAYAQQDVEDRVHVKWYNQVRGSTTTWDSTKLHEAQWTKSTVYAALAHYILPKLSTFRPEGDPFKEQIVFYKERLAEELDTQFALGIKYDTNDDGNIEEGEIYEYSQSRLYR